MERTQLTHAYWHHTIKLRLVAGWRLTWPILRQILGWLCILIGLLGLVLPVLQGIPFLVLGIALVGRRHMLIRWVSVHLKLFLRRWAALPTPLIGPLGLLALHGQQQVSRQRRRLHWWYMERKRLRAQHEAFADQEVKP